MVREGGIYIGICGGAFLGAHLEAFWGKSSHPPVRCVHWDFGASLGYMQGDMKLAKGRSAPKCFDSALDMLCRSEVYYENGPLLRCRESRKVRILARFSGRLKTYKKLHEYPPGLRAKLRLQNGLGAVVACRYGKGCILLVSPHPELTSGKRLVLGALWRAAQKWCQEEPCHADHAGYAS
jgi:glutamine amidotransferase-like uncharacterized protein